MGKSARTAESTQDTTGQLDSTQNQNQIRQLNEAQTVNQVAQTTGQTDQTTNQLVQSLSDILNQSRAVETGVGTQTIDTATGGLAAAQPGIQQILDQVAALSGRALAPTDQSTLAAATGFEQAAGGVGANIINPAGAFATQGLTAGGTGLETLSQFAQGNFGDSPLNQVIANRQETTSDLIRRITAAAGRSGSPAETGILGRELGKIGLEAQLGERQTDLNRQLSAAGQLPQEARGIFGQLLPFQQATTFAPQALQQAGAIRQDAAQTELDDPLAQIQRQQGIVFPASQLGQQTTGTTQDINRLVSEAASRQTGQEQTTSQTTQQTISDLIRSLTGVTTGQTTENISLENILRQLTSGQQQGTQTASLADTGIGVLNAASGFIPSGGGAVPIKQ